jgi:hypothetical protein
MKKLTVAFRNFANPLETRFRSVVQRASNSIFRTTRRTGGEDVGEEDAENIWTEAVRWDMKLGNKDIAQREAV